MSLDKSIVDDIEKLKRPSHRWRSDILSAREACILFLSRYEGIKPYSLIEDYDKIENPGQFILDVWESYLHDEPDRCIIQSLKIFIGMNNLMLGINQNLIHRKNYVLLMIYLLRDTYLSILADNFIPKRLPQLRVWLKESYLGNDEESYLCTQQLIRTHMRAIHLIRDLFRKLTQETSLPFDYINIGEEDYMESQINYCEDLRLQTLKAISKETKKMDYCKYIFRPTSPDNSKQKDLSKLERKIERYRLKIREKTNVIYDGRDSLSEIDSFLRTNNLYD